jgi:hypothetical protein
VFTAGSWKVEADGLTIAGFKPAEGGEGRVHRHGQEPHEVVGNHIAKYQSLRLAKMLMAYDFERRLNRSRNWAGSSSPSWATASRGRGRPR